MITYLSIYCMSVFICPFRTLYISYVVLCWFCRCVWQSRLPGLLQASCVFLDHGGTGLLCRRAESDRRLVPRHLEENQRGGTEFWVSVSYAERWPAEGEFRPRPRCTFAVWCKWLFRRHQGSHPPSWLDFWWSGHKSFIQDIHGFNSVRNSIWGEIKNKSGANLRFFPTLCAQQGLVTHFCWYLYPLATECFKNLQVWRDAVSCRRIVAKQQRGSLVCIMHVLQGKHALYVFNMMYFSTYSEVYTTGSSA